MSFTKARFLFKRKCPKSNIFIRQITNNVTLNQNLVKTNNLNYTLSPALFICEKNLTFSTKYILIRLQSLIQNHRSLAHNQVSFKYNRKSNNYTNLL